MARVKRGVTSHARHKKVLKQVKGQFGRRKNTIRVAKQALEKAMQYAYRDRRAKKRFRFTASGKIKMPQAGKRHGMIKRTNSQIRKQRGTTVMSKQDSKIVKSYMPYSLRG